MDRVIRWLIFVVLFCEASVNAGCILPNTSTNESEKTGGMHSNTTEIVWVNKCLTAVPQSICENCAVVEKFYLNKNEICDIRRNSFEDCANLEVLDLSSNCISAIDAQSFFQLERLLCLNLAENKLENITRQMLKGLFSVERLNLSHNEIDQIGNSAFVDMISLLELDLSTNNLTSITATVFCALQHLRHLDLQFNDISAIEQDSFANLKHLSSLNLQGNLITELKSGLFQGLNNLEFLNLEANAISYIRSNSFAFVYHVQKSPVQIDLQNNHVQVSEIPCDVFGKDIYTKPVNVSVLLQLQESTVCCCSVFWMHSSKKFCLQWKSCVFNETDSCWLKHFLSVSCTSQMVLEKKWQSQGRTKIHFLQNSVRLRTHTAVRGQLNSGLLHSVTVRANFYNVSLKQTVYFKCVGLFTQSIL